ncbi:hypothetical protein [Sphingomonas sp. URHD0057]|uniref:hypothetical protein n=1 Tax=Sphingomonas sp. URHD0057 TaxID=1380389 RepID=UPI00049190FF|nr:hypothetical protein [Sphingomonas sp. URHD0057]
MMMRPISILALAAALAAAAPAVAQNRAEPPARALHRNSAANSLSARIASVNARIAMLRDEQLISSEEALDLRDQSRSLTRRLHGMSSRDLRDLEYSLDRIESRVRYAMDDARWGHHVEGGPRHVDGDRDRYEVDRHDSDYEHFDRYTGSSVDRWHDPFDRGEPR